MLSILIAFFYLMTMTLFRAMFLRVFTACLLTFLSIFAAAQKTPLEKNPEALNFILMGDWGRNGEDHQKEVARQMGIVAEQASVDFIISAGDNFYPRGVASEFDPLWKYSFEDIYTAFSLQWDWFPVLGNHDYGSNPEAQIKYSKISRRWRMPARYYSEKFNLQGDTTQQVLFLFIDSSPFVKRYYAGKGHNIHDQDSAAQKAWIEKTLASASSNVKWKFVVGHHPMYTGGSRTEDSDTRSVRSSLKSLFKKYHVDAYLAGHEHSLQYMIADDGIHHFISGAASEKTPATMLPISKFAASEYGFMLFSATRQGITVQVVDYRGNILYKTVLKK
jgi:tartrate-resistant acid phosphatase type 5